MAEVGVSKEDTPQQQLENIRADAFYESVHSIAVHVRMISKEVLRSSRNNARNDVVPWRGRL